MSLSPSILQHGPLTESPHEDSRLLIAGPSGPNEMSKDELESHLSVADMQLWWRKGTGSALYQHVAVLFITWERKLDSFKLKCADEVSINLYTYLCVIANDYLNRLSHWRNYFENHLVT
jgi:hypothetical protein